jgi:hypothetical protein
MVASIKATLKNKITVLFIVLAVLALLAVPAFAQTPVPLEIDTNQLFSSTNTWIAVFLPIMAIGIGISIALALLTFIGQRIIAAFKGK